LFRTFKYIPDKTGRDGEKKKGRILKTCAGSILLNMFLAPFGYSKRPKPPPTVGWGRLERRQTEDRGYLVAILMTDSSLQSA
jgi:hypothetical protein